MLNNGWSIWSAPSVCCAIQLPDSLSIIFLYSGSFAMSHRSEYYALGSADNQLPSFSIVSEEWRIILDFVWISWASPFWYQFFKTPTMRRAWMSCDSAARHPLSSNLAGTGARPGASHSGWLGRPQMALPSSPRRHGCFVIWQFVLSVIFIVFEPLGAGFDCVHGFKMLSVPVCYASLWCHFVKLQWNRNILNRYKTWQWS